MSDSTEDVFCLPQGMCMRSLEPAGGIHDESVYNMKIVVHTNPQEDSVFRPGRPPQRTSIACLMQRHRWDNSRQECSCCGIGMVRKNLKFAHAYGAAHMMDKAAIHEAMHDLRYQSARDSKPRTHEKQQAQTEWENQSKYQHAGSYSEREQAREAKNYGRHTEVRLYIAIDPNPFTPKEVFGKYDNGIFYTIADVNKLWKISSPANYRQAPNMFHHKPWTYRYVGPPYDDYSGLTTVGKYSAVGMFGVLIRTTWQLVNPAHWKWIESAV